MQELNLKLGSKRNGENGGVSRSFLTTSLEELKEKKRKDEKKTKIVNTNVSREVMKAFVLHCVHMNKHRKEVFPVMLKLLLDRCKDSELVLESKLNGKEIDFTEKVNGNFEYDIEMIEQVKEFQAMNLVKFNVIYEQAIIQYLNRIN